MPMRLASTTRLRGLAGVAVVVTGAAGAAVGADIAGEDSKRGAEERCAPRHVGQAFEPEAVQESSLVATCPPYASTACAQAHVGFPMR
ncbi:hypothetical protein GCM10009749_32400 [Agromyces neolithicus]|uniref:Secreted protein n=1 Tax=Agromyces neolithicus TaxID=269420 RepID=A0ABN2MBX9_9MICO